MSFIDLSSPSIKIRISKDKEYDLSVFGMYQWAEYCRYIQYKKYFNLVDDKKRGLPITDIQLQEAYKECSEKTLQIDSPEIRGSLSGVVNLDNLGQIFYLSAKKLHPEIKYEEIAACLTLKHQAIIGKLVNDILAFGDDKEDDEVKNEETPSPMQQTINES